MPVPGLGCCGAVPSGFRGRGDRGRRQVAGSARASSRPCRGGRPLVPGWRCGTGKCSTRSERSRPRISTGRSASWQASRMGSYPASKITRMGGSPSRQCPAPAQPGDHVADLGSGDLGLVIIGSQADGVQHRRPRRAARLQRRDDRVTAVWRPTWHSGPPTEHAATPWQTNSEHSLSEILRLESASHVVDHTHAIRARRGPPGCRNGQTGRRSCRDTTAARLGRESMGTWAR
jgi:hypothetical protein